MVLAGSGRISPVPPYSGYRPVGQPYVYGAFTLCGHVFQTCSTLFVRLCAGPTTPCCMQQGLGCSAFARHYLRNHYCFLFLRVLRCFSSPGSCHAVGVTVPLHGTRLPHSDTHGSRVVCTSPWLFAAYRVLRHLWEPRHPPYALSCFLLSGALSKGTSWRSCCPRYSLLCFPSVSFFLSHPCQ